MPCPRYDEELQRVLSEDVKREIENNAGMLERLSNITGLEIKTPDEVQSLYNTLKAEVSSHHVLRPSRTKQIFSTVGVRVEASAVDERIFPQQAATNHRPKLRVQLVQR